jgi:hypothetical protein
MSINQIDTRLQLSSETDRSLKSPSQTTKTSSDSEPNKAVSSNELTLLQRQRKEFNAAILQSNYDVNLSIKNEPLSLVYKTAIDAINEELKDDFGDNSIQKGYQQGLDVSPEATAGRIVSFSTGLFSLYQKQHPELDELQQVEKFIDIIGGGINTGFTEAKDILDGLGVLEGEIAENIDKTYDLVQQGLQDFRAKFESLPAETPVDKLIA